VDNDGERFYQWMRNAKSPDELETVMGRVMWLRNEIMREHGLKASDVGLKSMSILPNPRKCPLIREGDES
jgi:hypothetical protein